MYQHIIYRLYSYMDGEKTEKETYKGRIDTVIINGVAFDYKNNTLQPDTDRTNLW